MRVVAIVTVVQYHVTWMLAGENGIKLHKEFMRSSLSIFFGMDLFFVLSGFLIGSILLRSLETSKPGTIGRFYLRRIFRTFPSYYVVLTALAVLFPLTAAQREHLPYEYLYATNTLSLSRGQVIMFWGWSLALEEQFYLAVPALFLLLRRLRTDRGRIILLASVCVFALLLRIYLYYRFAPWTDLMLYGAIYFRTPTRFDPLLAGIILAIVHHRYREALTRWLEKPFHRALLLLPSLGCLWLLVDQELFGKEHQQLFHMFAWGTLTSLMYIAWVPLLLYGDGWLHRALSAPFWRRIATLGYGVYLVHIPLIDHVIVPVARTLDKRHVSMLVVWPASLVALMAMSLGVAYFLHVLVEKPALRIRERFAG